MLFGSVPIVVFSFGVFLKPLAHDFHVGRAAISFAFTLHNIAVAAAAPLAGRLVDRLGARKVILPATLVMGTVLSQVASPPQGYGNFTPSLRL